MSFLFRKNWRKLVIQLVPVAPLPCAQPEKTETLTNKSENSKTEATGIHLRPSTVMQSASIHHADEPNAFKDEPQWQHTFKTTKSNRREREPQLNKTFSSLVGSLELAGLL